MSARPMHLLALAAALLLVLAGPRSLAQEPPPVRIDAVVEAEGTPYVGQRVTVVVTLYTLTNFDTAPAFDLPPVDGAVLLPPEDRPVLGTTSVDDETYTTGRHELAFFAQRAGTLELPSFKVRFASPPAWGEAPVEHGLMTPALEIEAVMPPGAEGLASVICATELSAEQSLTPEAESVKVGDALTRTVTLRAEGVPGMALPPTLVGEVEGASSYPAEPTVTDDRARGAFAGARTDQVTYVFEREGTAQLPALVIRWWNLSEERLETIRLPGARVVVEPAPKAAVTEAAAPAKDPRPGWPLAVLAAFGLLAVLALRPLAAWGEARRQRHAASEVGRFDALEAACRRSDPRAALVALYPWIAALRTSPELSTLESLAPAVSVELQQELLAAATEGRDWEGKAFLAALMRVRAQRAGVIAQQASPLAPLNP